MDRMKENVIEWRDGDRVAKCTLARGRFVTKVRRLVEKGAPGARIIHENPDGSIFCQISLKDLHITHFTAHGNFPVSETPTGASPEGSNSNDSDSDDIFID